ncbi:hypothetical protein [Tetragenococcus halophilus]|nr:hypothetical protein [Tetragenococcus halophilus]
MNEKQVDIYEGLIEAYQGLEKKYPGDSDNILATISICTPSSNGRNTDADFIPALQAFLREVEG